MFFVLLLHLRSHFQWIWLMYTHTLRDSNRWNSIHITIDHLESFTRQEHTTIQTDGTRPKGPEKRKKTISIKMEFRRNFTIDSNGNASARLFDDCVLIWSVDYGFYSFDRPDLIWIWFYVWTFEFIYIYTNKCMIQIQSPPPPECKVQ